MLSAASCSSRVSVYPVAFDLAAVLAAESCQTMAIFCDRAGHEGVDDAIVRASLPICSRGGFHGDTRRRSEIDFGARRWFRRARLGPVTWNG